MATSIDDNAADGNLDKFNVKLLNIRCTSTANTNACAFSPVSFLPVCAA